MNKHRPSALSPSASHPFRGVPLFVSALFLFACMDTTTQFLATHYNAPLVVAMRYIMHCLLMIAILAPSQGKRLVQTQRIGLVLVRTACLAIASLFVGLALRRMPVAETTAIHFVAPMLVVLLARPVLGEHRLWAGLLGWIAFGQVPDRPSILGMGVVAASGVMIALKTRQPTSGLSARILARAWPASKQCHVSAY